MKRSDWYFIAGSICIASTQRLAAVGVSICMLICAVGHYMIETKQGPPQEQQERVPIEEGIYMLGAIIILVTMMLGTIWLVVRLFGKGV